MCDPYLQRAAAALYYRVHNALSEVEMPENVGDFRLMDREVVAALRALPQRRRFMKGLFARVGFRTAIVEYTRAPPHADARGRQRRGAQGVGQVERGRAAWSCTAS